MQPVRKFEIHFCKICRKFFLEERRSSHKKGLGHIEHFEHFEHNSQRLVDGGQRAEAEKIREICDEICEKNLKSHKSPAPEFTCEFVAN